MKEAKRLNMVCLGNIVGHRSGSVAMWSLHGKPKVLVSSPDENLIYCINECTNSKKTMQNAAQIILLY